MDLRSTPRAPPVPKRSAQDKSKRASTVPPVLQARARVGQYRLVKRLGEGGFATVWKAFDSIEGIHVAIKIPRPELIDKTVLDLFRKEVRVTAPLDHPGILPIKTATHIDGLFLIVHPLGLESLDDRLKRRLSFEKGLAYCEQILAALAYAHAKKVIHCDVKPDNFILFEDDRLRLADFGIAKVAQKTLEAQGTGTVGYVAPEQAYGKISFRSDVFAAGLVMVRILSGHLPEWPFEWPSPGIAKLKRNASPDLLDFLRRTVEVSAKKRFPSAIEAHNAFVRIRPHALAYDSKRKAKRHRANGRATPKSGGTKDWKEVRRISFQRRFGKVLESKTACQRCAMPLSPEMQHCPWCKKEQPRFKGEVRHSHACPRCKRGVKADWHYCPYCWGSAIGPNTTRELSDKRYSARCTNSKCSRKDLMPFMRYCPWCHTKVQRKWPLPGSRSKCERCAWGVSREFWSCCPWCSAKVKPTKG